MTTRLREALRSRNEQLLKQVESLVDRVTPQLWHTWSTFQTGTKHTPEHTQSVEAIASLLLSDDAIAAMKDDEIAMLILACHFHDLGMAGTEADNATDEGRDRVRKEHAISIGERIRERWQELGFENQNYAEVLAEVCRGHRPDKLNGFANWNSLPVHRNIGPDRFVRLRLVSAMVYAADELHLGDDRRRNVRKNGKKSQPPNRCGTGAGIRLCPDQRDQLRRFASMYASIPFRSKRIFERCSRRRSSPSQT